MRRCIRSQTQHERSSKTQQAIRVLNLAHIGDSPIAKVVLAMSSIEALVADSQGWTSTQLAMVRQAAGWVRGEFGESVHASEAADAIKRLHHRSLRQQAKRLLEKHETAKGRPVAQARRLRPSWQRQSTPQPVVPCASDHGFLGTSAATRYARSRVCPMGYY